MRMPSMTETPSSEMKPITAEMLSTWPVAYSARMPPKTVNGTEARDRKSTRLNSSHGYISYAVFCLKKKKNTHSHMLDLVQPIFTLHPVVHHVRGERPRSAY